MPKPFKNSQSKNTKSMQKHKVNAVRCSQQSWLTVKIPKFGKRAQSECMCGKCANGWLVWGGHG
jgi:hypothetical protein